MTGSIELIQKMRSVLSPIDPNDFFVGEFHGHTYISFQGIRLEGNLFEFARGNQHDNNHLDTDGVALKFQVPAHIHERLNRALSERYFGITCNDVICKAMKEGGLQVTHNYLSQYLPGFLLSALKKDGLKDEKGSLLPVTVYQIGNEGLDHRISVNTRSEAIIGGALLVMVGGVGYVIYTQQDKDEEKEKQE